MTKTMNTILIFLLLMQGGFFPNTYLLAGLLFSFLLFILAPTVKIYLPTFLSFLVLAMHYFISALIHNFSAADYSPILQIFVYVLFCLLLWGLEDEKGEHLIDGILIATILTAYISLLSYVGLLPIKGMIVKGRMQGVMQYANATAVFLSMGLLLINKNPKKFYKYKPALLMGLQLTMSMGGILAFLFGLVLYSFSQKKKLIFLLGEAIEFIISASFSALIYISIFIFEVKLLGIFMAIMGCCMGLIWNKIRTYLIGKKRVYISIILLGILETLGLLFYRGLEAAATFEERMIHSKDGIRVLMKHPLFGLGPGRWALEKENWQGIKYYSAKLIHNSYMQISVDAGIITLLCIILLIYIWIRKKNKQSWEYSSLGCLLLHSLIDCSLYFTGISLAGIVIGSYPTESKRKYLSIQKTIIRIIALLFLFIYAWSIWKMIL